MEVGLGVARGEFGFELEFELELEWELLVAAAGADALAATGSRGGAHGTCLLMLWCRMPRPVSALLLLLLPLLLRLRLPLRFSGLPSTEPVDKRNALYLREGISANAGFDRALALIDERWDEVECLFVGVAVALLDPVDVCVWLVCGLWSGVRGDEGLLTLLIWKLDTSALRRVA